jgi:hypothetical protein
MAAPQLQVDQSTSAPPPPAPPEKEASGGISIKAWAMFGAVFLAGVAVVYFTYGGAMKPWLRWGITGAWALVTIGLGIYDLILDAGGEGETDATPFDRWSISHAGAGVVFGVWFVPLWAVLAMTIVWELFEVYVPGFGESEIMRNRVVDVGSAVVAWLVIVLVAMGTHGATAEFPLVWAR